MVCELLALLGAHLTLALQIALVADEDARDVVSGVLLNLGHPVLNSAEGLAISDVVGHDDAVGALVVAGSNSFEAFLASSVPNLELDGLAVDFVIADLEVHADSGHEAFCEGVFLQAPSGLVTERTGRHLNRRLDQAWRSNLLRI